MKKLYFILAAVCMLVPAVTMAQSDCGGASQKNRSQGEAAYKSGDYKKAIECFNDAASCPSITKKQREELDEWVGKCTQALKASKKQSAPDATPQVEILYTGYITATCVEGRRGAKLDVVIEAKNLKDKRLKARCLMAPASGNGRILVGSDPKGNYTVQGAMSGQDQEFLVSDQVEYISATFFVPFSVMNFSGKYGAQNLKVDLSVTQVGGRTPLATLKQTYEGLEVHTIAVEKATDTYEWNKPIEYTGGTLDILPAVCPGNKFVWSRLPAWIKSDDEGLHVAENPSDKSRTATIRVASSEGGNTVKVTVNQRGRLERETATGKINEVWTEEDLVSQRDGYRKFVIHVDCEVSGARGKEIRAYAVFYCPDGRIPLRSPSGEEITCFNKSRANYAESSFDDFPITVFYSRITNAKNNRRKEAKYYVCLSEDGGQSWIARSGPYTIKWD